MQHIIVPGGEQRRLVFYLALEEWVSANLGEGFFVWSVNPTVIIGRNQDLEAEVNLDFCRSNNIEVYRRKSGGGCVYSDKGNLMISCITPKDSSRDAFADYLSNLCTVLRWLGLDAVSSERNDVLVSGLKVSGNACFQHPRATVVHGTLLYDCDMHKLEQSITPSAEKLGSHGVKSVRQRVSTLLELGLDAPAEFVEDFLIEYFTDSSRTLTPEEILQVEEIEKTYLEPGFIIGKKD